MFLEAPNRTITRYFSSLDVDDFRGSTSGGTQCHTAVTREPSEDLIS